MEQGTASTLGALPIELLQRIFEPISDSREIFKSLRLTCRALVVPASDYLFRRIRLSTLKRDREIFLRVAESPHLACHVRVLVWEEVSFDGTVTGNPLWSTLMGDFPNLPQQLQQVLWVPLLSSQSRVTEIDEIAQFTPVLEQAVLRMPNLQTLVSEQMHPYRRLLPPLEATEQLEDYYPIQAHHLQRLAHPRTDEADVLFNPGFFALLVPLMSKLAHLNVEQGIQVPTIKHLQVYFEQDRCLPDRPVWPIISGLQLDSPTRPNPFASLTHVTICFSGSWHRSLVEDSTSQNPERGVRRYAAIKARILNILDGAIETITHFHLCRQSTWDEWGSPSRSILRDLPHMPRLRALHMDCVYHDDTLMQHPRDRPPPEDNRTGRTESALVAFVRDHKNTLRELFIKGTPITFAVLNNLAGIDGLMLEKFEALPFGLHGNNYRMQYHVPEEDVLAFVNGPRKLERFTHDETQLSEGLQLCTTTMDEDEAQITSGTDMERHLPEWSKCRARLRVPDPEEDVEMMEHERTWIDSAGREQEFGASRIRHEGSASIGFTEGLWEDKDGLLYDPMTDETVGRDGELYCDLLQEAEGSISNGIVRTKESSDRKQGTTSTWSQRNDRTWDADLGLWRGPLGWHRFASDDCAANVTEARVARVLETEIQHYSNQYSQTVGPGGYHINLGLEVSAHPDETNDAGQESEAEGVRRYSAWERLDDTSLAKYHREQLSHLLRQRRRDKDYCWDFARDEFGTLYCRPSGEGGGSVAAEVWHFKHRNGEDAHGTEPLDFWSDWEGSQAGDTYEPTLCGPFFWSLADGASNENVDEDIDLERVTSTDAASQGWTEYGLEESLHRDTDIWRSVPGPLTTQPLSTAHDLSEYILPLNLH